MGATFMLMMMVQGGPSTTRRLLAESGFSGLIWAHLLLFNFCFYRMRANFAQHAQGTRVVGFSDLGSALHSREFGVERLRCSHAAVERPDQKGYLGSGLR